MMLIQIVLIVPEARRQQDAWNEYIDFSKIKAFVNVAISPSIEWGTRNIVLSAGLGGMRPNIVIMGMYNIQQFRKEQPLVDVPSPPPERKHAHQQPDESPGLNKRKRNRGKNQLEGALPTDTCYVESRTDVQSYVMVLEDMLLKLQINVAIATGFQELELPNSVDGNKKKFIDLWPIQMSAQLETMEGDLLTTNFDTYTLIMQLGCILNTVPSWKQSYKLRVAVFVEYESDVTEERTRVAELLDNLRIEAQIMVFWLASGDVKSYQVIINGDDSDAEAEGQVEKVLEDEEWWQGVKGMRGKAPMTGDTSAVEELSMVDDASLWPGSGSPQGSKRDASVARYDDRLRNLIRQSRRRQSFSNFSSFGVGMGMRTQRLSHDMISRHASHASASEESDPEESTSGDSNSAEEGSDEDDEGSLDLSASESFNDQTAASREAGNSTRSPSPRSRKTHSKKSSLSSKSRSSRKKASQPSAQTSGSNELSKLKLQALDAENDLVNLTSPATSPLSEDNEPRGRPGVAMDAPGVDAVESDLTDNFIPQSDHRHRSRSSSPGKFTSSPVPKIKVAEDDVGPSIMFVDEPKPLRKRLTDKENTDVDNSRHASRHASRPRSIYQRNVESRSPSKHQNSAGGFPASASIPISFNDLPCRAQHLILNELITQQSEHTAVIFTTLPAPLEGTYKSEADSLGYVSDLEVLCGGLPPTLLVHSNSMTVTMNL